MSEKVPATVSPATMDDLYATRGWQTQWTTKAVMNMPNKIALRRVDDSELLGLISYELDTAGMAVKVIYLESAAHSNANVLRIKGASQKYIGIGRALFAYAVSVSMDAGFDGVIYFKAKTSELREYYMKQFGAIPLASYDSFRMIIWEDAAHTLISDYL